MEQRKLSRWLKCIIAGVGICGLFLYAIVIPVFGLNLRIIYPEFSHCFWHWLVFLWVSAVPCYAGLFFCWKIATNIGKNQSFSIANAKKFKWISVLSAGDAIYFFVGNIVLFFLEMNHPSVMIASLTVVFVGVAVSVAAEVLSRLVMKAAALQEQSDWTI